MTEHNIGIDISKSHLDAFHLEADQASALSYDFPCSRGNREPWPATPFMAGHGGGWIVSARVLQDRY
jgi:hypothetical protein